MMAAPMTEPTHSDLRWARALTLGPVVLAIPVGSVAVFQLGVDRALAADGIAWVYSVGLFLAFSTAAWPLPSLRGWTPLRRAQSAALFFVVVSYATHLSWELGWLLLHDRIAEARDAAWAYGWWAYIDGGDSRYAVAPPGLLGIEILSVVNGSVGVLGLVLYRRSEGRDPRSVLLLMATAVVHLYSTSFYFLEELIGGLPSVDTTSFTATYVKFGLANLPWVTLPWVVLYWGQATLRADLTRSSASPPGATAG